MCQGLFLNKVAGLRPATLFKKTLAQVFSYEFCEISRTPLDKCFCNTNISFFILLTLVHKQSPSILFLNGSM